MQIDMICYKSYAGFHTSPVLTTSKFLIVVHTYDRKFKSPKTGVNIEMNVMVSKYKGRYWAVFLNDQLIAVTVYKKGAVEIQRLIEQLSSKDADCD
jgi:hypothetical protein